MARKPPMTFGPPRDSYGELIHRPLNQLLVIGPLLVIFQLGAMRFGSDLLVPQYLEIALKWFGAPGRFLPPVLILAVLLGQHLTRRDPWMPSGWAGLAILVESAFWVLPLLAISFLTRRFEPAVTNNLASMQPWLSAIGAGVYEEFLFRLALINLVMLVGVDLIGQNRLATAGVGLGLSAVLFAAAHFVGWPFQWSRAIFLTLAGLWWGVLFIWRGYASAACCHIWWDILVLALAE